MAHSFTSSLFHCVFSTKERRPFITSDLQVRLWPYMGGIARDNGMKALVVGGVEDHLTNFPHTKTSHGRKATEHSASAYRSVTQPSRTSKSSRSITGKPRSRKSSWRFSRNTRSSTILGTSGVNRHRRSPFQSSLRDSTTSPRFQPSTKVLGYFQPSLPGLKTG